MTSWDEMSSLVEDLASVKPYPAGEGCPQTIEWGYEKAQRLVELGRIAANLMHVHAYES